MGSLCGNRTRFEVCLEGVGWVYSDMGRVSGPLLLRPLWLLNFPSVMGGKDS